MTEAHHPVMLADVIDVLGPRDGGLYVDGTFGAGGYARALLDAADCAVIGIDRDAAAVEGGRALAEGYGGRLTVLHGRFGDMAELLATHNIESVDGVALDLGVSSMQLDQAGRGFSFAKDGPLDMRMDAGAGISAAEAVNTLDEDELARVIAVYGEERRARAIARAIAAARARAPLSRTGELAGIVTGVLGAPRAGRIHPATRTFQGLRIFVNDELGELARGLTAAERVLKPTGRLAVVAFHSLEDRYVKRFLAVRSGDAGRGSRHLPEAGTAQAPSFRLVYRGARKPSDDEIRINPRARSARLRAAERTSAPPWPMDAPLSHERRRA